VTGWYDKLCSSKGRGLSGGETVLCLRYRLIRTGPFDIVGRI